MGLCVLYYVEYSLYNVKKVGFFYLGWNFTFKFKAFADEKCYQILKILLGSVENIVGKGENDGNQHFLLFQQCFQKLSFSGWLKLWIVR